MTGFTLTCQDCGENTNYASQDLFIEAVRNHSKGHRVKLMGRSKTMNNEAMGKLLDDILRQVKR